MKYLLFIGLTAAIICYADLAVAKTPAEIESIAKAVTVEIRLLQDESIGSGIIIDRKGDIYTLVTNRHVVCGQTRNCTTPPEGETYTVKLGDEQKYQLSAKSVKLLGNGLDLAMIQFRSNRTYPVAQIEDAGSLKAGNRIYTSGYPATPPGFSFNAGDVIAVVNKRLTEDRGGYTVIYDAATQPGMSGGGVFSQTGRLMAIHGQGGRFRENTELEMVVSSGISRIKKEVGSKIGYNRGIPVQWVVQGLSGHDIRLRNRQPVNLGQTAASSADEHFITGFNKLVEPGTDVVASKQLAISEFSQAIRMNPRYTYAYFMRAITYAQLQEDRQAVADYDHVIALDPRFVSAYSNRGSLKADKNDSQGALADYNQAITLNPKVALDYYNRGNLKADKNDSQGALADYNQAITLNPKFANAYNNRGSLKQRKLNNQQGALADYDWAIALDPTYAIAYTNRGALKYELNDFRGALSDFDQAIALKPKLSQIYYNRGLLKYTNLGDRSGGIADMRQAAKLSRAQGNSRVLQTTLQILLSWGVGE
jgi:lipoprotein NlpI